MSSHAFRARSASSSLFMTKSLPETPSLARLVQGGAGRGRVVATPDHVLPLDSFERASSLRSHLARLEGRSVILSVGDMAKAAAALIDLDGCARRIVLCPPGWEQSRVESAGRDAEADALVYDSRPADRRRIPRALLFAAPAVACAARCEPRNRMDLANLRYERTAQARRAHTADSDGRDL